MDQPIDLLQFPVYVTEGTSYAIQPERFADIIPELHQQHTEHWRETEGHRHELGLKANYERAVGMERAGKLIQFVARDEHGAMVANLRFYLGESAHTQTIVAEEDTFYVAPAHRSNGLGTQLFGYAERCLAQLGVREIRANVKMVNNARHVMEAMGFRAVAIQYHKLIEETPNVR